MRAAQQAQGAAGQSGDDDEDESFFSRHGRKIVIGLGLLGTMAFVVMAMQDDEKNQQPIQA